MSKVTLLYASVHYKNTKKVVDYIETNFGYEMDRSHVMDLILLLHQIRLLHTLGHIFNLNRILDLGLRLADAAAHLTDRGDDGRLQSPHLAEGRGSHRGIHGRTAGEQHSRRKNTDDDDDDQQLDEGETFTHFHDNSSL